MQIDIRRSRDFWAGLMLIGIGAGSMFVARDYAFGTSLRMGPGYFPSVLGGVLILFGLVLLVRGWRIRERLEPGWSPRALIILPFAFVLFGALIERTGFVPALSALIVVAAAASREFEPSRGRHPCSVPHGDVGRGLRLGIGAALPALSGLLSAMELFDNLALRLRRRRLTAEPSLLLHRRPGRHADRRTARHRPARDNRHAPADHLQRAAGRRAHHARRHLLRRAIRRLHHRHPGKSSRRDRLGHHLPRRLPDGAAGTRRTGPRHRGDRLVLRRHGRHAANRPRRAAARGGGPTLRRARILLPDADGPCRAPPFSPRATS